MPKLSFNSLLHFSVNGSSKNIKYIIHNQYLLKQAVLPTLKKGYQHQDQRKILHRTTVNKDLPYQQVT